MSILQIIPKPFHLRCGIGDYSSHLAVELERLTGSPTRFFSHHIGLNDDVIASEIAERTLDLRALSLPNSDHLIGRESAFILHYSGYGYAKRGAPVWLYRQVNRIRDRHPSTPWITMFHEVAASGPLWTSAFWLRPLQRLVARLLHDASDGSITNCTRNAEALKALLPDNSPDLPICPVFSNFGDPETSPKSSLRDPSVVIFASNFGAKIPSLGFWDELAEALSAVGGKRVVVIGRDIEVPGQFPFVVEKPGYLSPQDVSAVLSRSKFGYAFLGPELFAKSGIFAAFAAHGVVPVVPTSCSSLPDGLTAHVHYHPTRGSSPISRPDEYFDAIGSNIQQWYNPHSAASTASVFASTISRALKQLRSE